MLARTEKTFLGYYKLYHVCLSVRPSIRLFVRMEQHASHWMDFNDILFYFFFNVSRKFMFD